MADRFDYADYEFKLRDRQLIRGGLTGYVPHFQGCRKVLDLACGSGIFLELLAEQGIPALGVERNPAVVAWVKQHGWDIVEQDAFAFLERTTETYDGVFCSHFLEHLPFEQVLRLFELLAPRVVAGGTVVLVVPNPESVRMQLFGFWRDPEHVRFYHPELLEAVCQHAGFQVIASNREDRPFALPAPAFSWTEENGRHPSGPQRGWLKETVRALYFRFLRLLRIAPYADVFAMEAHLRQCMEAQRETVAAWAATTHAVVNRIWAPPDDAVIVGRKTETASGRDEMSRDG